MKLILALLLVHMLMSCGVTRRTYTRAMRDYQIELHMDTVWIYDGNRLVYMYLSNWTNQMDTAIMKDNL